MKNFSISPLTQKLTVRFSGKKVILSEDIQNKIDTYWESLLQSGKKYTRGEVFTVTKKEIFPNGIDILVEKTDYAHYLYCQNVETLGKYNVCIVHTAVLVETKDNKFIFGRMGDQTSRAGIYQLCGGGIDNKDLRGDLFDFDHNARNELLEELGIDTGDKKRVSSFSLAYFKQGGPTEKMTVVYKARLKETSRQFIDSYDNFVTELQENGEQPEFGKIIVLKNDKDSINTFFNSENTEFDEYMKPLFYFISNAPK